jgi:hypothetical protein
VDRERTGNIRLLEKKNRWGAATCETSVKSRLRRPALNGDRTDRRCCVEEGRDREIGVGISGRLIVGRMMRASDTGCVAAPRGTFLKKDEVGMQIVGKRNHEEQWHQRASKRRPLAPRGMVAIARLMNPTSAPHAETCGGNHHPQNIEK